ncbi:MAG: hypothetical protein FJ388_21380 [Verrucomicrobia bacterium]|nr:hypothetical protein [Verrucomicrobiota bacterium]
MATVTGRPTFAVSDGVEASVVARFERDAEGTEELGLGELCVLLRRCVHAMTSEQKRSVAEALLEGRL